MGAVSGTRIETSLLGDGAPDRQPARGSGAGTRLDRWHVTVTGAQRVDWPRWTECLRRHGVAYLIVGGVGAQLPGAQRLTFNFDSLPATSNENLGRLATAMGS